MPAKKTSIPPKTGKNTKRKANNRKATEPKGLKIQVISIILLMLAVFSWVSIYKFRDMPYDDQFIGVLGSYYLKGLDLAFSQGVFLIPLFLLFWSIHSGVWKKLWSSRMWGASLLSLLILLSISIYQIPEGISEWEAGFKGMGGGYLGAVLSYVLIKLVGRLGTQIIIVFGIAISVVMMIDRPLPELAKAGLRWGQGLGAALSSLIFEVDEEEKAVPSSRRKPAPLIIDTVQEEMQELDFFSQREEPAMPFPAVDQPQAKEPWPELERCTQMHNHIKGYALMNTKQVLKNHQVSRTAHRQKLG
jgi:S-DNA-T family DNA segregation ATPase FtsK/SpoIIIE